jgi:hypothetical protein
VNRTNPYRPPFDRWSDDVRAAYAAMPTNRDGMVINPRYLPSVTEQRALTARWREWSRRFPAYLHPTWLESWFAECSANGLTP